MRMFLDNILLSGTLSALITREVGMLFKTGVERADEFVNNFYVLKSQNIQFRLNERKRTRKALFL